MAHFVSHLRYGEQGEARAVDGVMMFGSLTVSGILLALDTRVGVINFPRQGGLLAPG
jgi:hypothetical protein